MINVTKCFKWETFPLFLFLFIYLKVLSSRSTFRVFTIKCDEDNKLEGLILGFIFIIYLNKK